jgi:hypothetical protein
VGRQRGRGRGLAVCSLPRAPSSRPHSRATAAATPRAHRPSPPLPPPRSHSRPAAAPPPPQPRRPGSPVPPGDPIPRASPIGSAIAIEPAPPRALRARDQALAALASAPAAAVRVRVRALRPIQGAADPQSSESGAGTGCLLLCRGQSSSGLPSDLALLIRHPRHPRPTQPHPRARRSIGPARTRRTCLA